MLRELVVLSGVAGFVLGVLELSHRLNGAPDLPLTAEAAIRAALAGPEASAIRAEYGRRDPGRPSPPLILGF
jgi:hypothetical protein